MASVRIIAGEFGGRILDAPPYTNKRTHPMSERIRNAMFNSLGAAVQNMVVLDAFAGTGAIGLEALSRGASHLVCVEKDQIAYKILHHNIQLLGVEDKARAVHTTVINWLSTHDSMTSYDLIFADPPYYDTQIQSIQALVSVLAEKGMLVLSWPERELAPEFIGLKLLQNRIYAGARIYMYKKS
jgi:16S rRNA (guanine966-N2)-methyltransferase